MCDTKLKIILFDIETSLAVVGAFGLWNDGIPYTNILSDWYIHCICYKQLGKKKIHELKNYTNDDREICEKFAEVLRDTDVIVGHNANKFDVKKFNARLIYHNIDPIGPIVCIDTLREIKKVATFTSHRLDYLCKILVDDTKMATEGGLWMDAIRGDKKAIDKMSKYCAQDVNLLEKLYLRIHKYIKGHPNLSRSDQLSCTHCGSVDFFKYGTIMMKSGAVYQKHKCKNCATVFRDTITISKPQGRPL
jgi:DNA polymerase elongation subunit (family B)